jgi:hypothetical protein
MDLWIYGSMDLWIYILIIGFFIIIASPSLLSEGMFMDGLIYANISANLAKGLGSFWSPHFSET